MSQNWFKHDYNARNDDKLLELRAEMGWKGYGLFFALVEIMCENEKGYIDGQKIGGLSVGLGVPIDTLQELIEHCLDVGLLFVGEDEMLHNSRVDHHVSKMKSFVEAGKKGAKKRWSNNSDRGANGRANTGAYADKSRVDKNKDNSVSTNGTDFPQSCEFISEAKEIAQYLKDAICEYDSTHRYNHNPPSLSSWVLEIERAMRLDGRTEEQLKFIIDYIYRRNGKHSGFWAGNIESGNKLRQQFDKIKNQIREEQSSKQDKIKPSTPMQVV